jgi:hypothetical protein
MNSIENTAKQYIKILEGLKTTINLMEDGGLAAAASKSLNSKATTHSGDLAKNKDKGGYSGDQSVPTAISKKWRTINKTYIAPLIKELDKLAATFARDKAGVYKKDKGVFKFGQYKFYPNDGTTQQQDQQDQQGVAVDSVQDMESGYWKYSQLIIICTALLLKFIDANQIPVILRWASSFKPYIDGNIFFGTIANSSLEKTMLSKKKIVKNNDDKVINEMLQKATFDFLYLDISVTTGKSIVKSKKEKTANWVKNNGRLPYITRDWDLMLKDMQAAGFTATRFRDYLDSRKNKLSNLPLKLSEIDPNNPDANEKGIVADKVLRTKTVLLTGIKVTNIDDMRVSAAGSRTDISFVAIGLV